MPFARSTPIFSYNKEAWREAGLPDRGPETWDEFLTWVPKLIKRDGGNVVRYAVAHPGAASYIAWLFQCVAWQWGGAYSDPDFKIRIAEPPVVRAGEFYRSSTTQGWASTPQNLDNEFRGGVAAAIMGSTAGLAGHEQNARFPVGTAFLPKGPAGFGCCTGGSGLAVLTTAPKEKQDAAFKYIMFATSPENTAFWSQNTGYMPVRKSAIDGPMKSFYAERPNYQTTVRQLPLTKPQDAAHVFIPNGNQIIGKGLVLQRQFTKQTQAAFGVGKLGAVVARLGLGEPGAQLRGRPGVARQDLAQDAADLGPREPRLVFPPTPAGSSAETRRPAGSGRDGDASRASRGPRTHPGRSPPC